MQVVQQHLVESTLTTRGILVESLRHLVDLSLVAISRLGRSQRVAITCVRLGLVDFNLLAGFKTHEFFLHFSKSRMSFNKFLQYVGEADKHTASDVAGCAVGGHMDQLVS